MARKKAAQHIFKHPDLNEPAVVRRADLALGRKDSEEQIAQLEAANARELTRRFMLLFQEFNIDLGTDLASMLAASMRLSYELASIYVPGMQRTFDRRPERGRPKVEISWRNPIFLLPMIDDLRKKGIQSVNKACEVLVLLEKPDLAGQKNKTARDKAVRTLANLVSKARTDAARVRH